MFYKILFKGVVFAKHVVSSRRFTHAKIIKTGLYPESFIRKRKKPLTEVRMHLLVPQSFSRIA